MVAVPVNKDVLVWARKERGLSEKEAAKRLKLSEEQLAEYESGAKPPSLGLLDKIAQKYQIPFASLMMPEPLALSKRPADFRTYEGKEPIWDEHLLVSLETVNHQLELFSELKVHDPALFAGPPLRNYSMKQTASEVAAEERKLSGVSLDAQFAWPSGAQAFRYWRHVVERAGVFVQIMDLGPENLCRGFSVYDEREIPAAVINGDEGEGPARTFTLLHEYAHILVRQPGISDQNRRNSTEKWCNQFAAHFLMPANSFKADAVSIDPTRSWSDTVVRKIAEKYNVSMSSVVLHLEEVGLAKPGLYDAKLEEWRKRKRTKGGQIMSYPERQVHRLGVRHVGVVMDAMDRRDINSLEAFEMMSVTYYVALPFINSEEGPVPAEAMECPNEGAAILKAEAMFRKEGVVGALAFKRTGQPNEGIFGEPTILRTFGLVPENLDEL